MSIVRISVLFSALSFAIGQEDSGETIVVGTQLGKVEGLVVRGEDEEVDFYSFRGIPFAEPPVGSLRFRDPVPKKPWAVTRNATQFGASCVQPDLFGIGASSSEDCLFLNVFTPTLPSKRSAWIPDKSAYKPVMVFIHGGGFQSGSAKEYDPTLIVDRDVVLVTIQYRLNVFGFFSLDHPLAAGNQGLKDQLMALEWVRANIAFFGGNPNKVTIFGESAGGESVHLQVLSSQGKGLYQGAIMQSGTAYLSHGLRRGRLTEKSSARLVEKVGCVVGNTYNKVANLECLQALDAADLKEAISSDTTSFTAAFERELVNGTAPITFAPIADKHSIRPLFTELPLTRLLNQQFKRIPIMIGGTKDEGALITAVEWTNLNKTSQYLSSIVGNTMYGVLASEVTPEIDIQADVLRQFYMNGQNFSQDLKFEINNLFSDLYFHPGSYLTAKAHAEANLPVYMYYLTHKPSFSFSSILGAASGIGLEDLGVAHADDLSFLFKSDGYGLPEWEPIKTEEDKETSDNMLTLWTNFAKYLDPTPYQNQSMNQSWKSFTNENEYFMELKSDLELQKGFLPKRMYFMEKLIFDDLNKEAKSSARFFPFGGIGQDKFFFY